MKLEVERSVRGAAEFTRKTVKEKVKAHAQGLLATGTVLFALGGIGSIAEVAREIPHQSRETDAQLQLRYPGLPSQESLDESTQTISTSDQNLIAEREGLRQEMSRAKRERYINLIGLGLYSGYIALMMNFFRQAINKSRSLPTETF